MAPAPQSRGQCAFCGFQTTKGAMSKHMAACPKRKGLVESAEEAGRKPETLYYLRAQDAHSRDFWLDLEVRGTTKLKHIDSYLRAIWLECCGHLSQFSIGGWAGDEIAMSRKVEAVFVNKDVELTHIYDFGTSSITKLKSLGTRDGSPMDSHVVNLLARNLMPEAQCLICGKPATYFCTECQIEDQTSGMLCAEHAEDHPHEDYGEPIALVNSPRMGMCGYDGPAEPPY